MNQQWPKFKELAWIYSHKSILNDLIDSKNISNVAIYMVSNKDTDMYEKYIKYFYKWIKLVITNILYHYIYKHQYYFPKFKYPICTTLIEEYKEIDILLIRIKNRAHTNINISSSILELIKEDIKELLRLITINFNKETAILLPKIMSDYNYSIFRKIDIKVGLKAKWYALPHLYRNISTEHSIYHMTKILNIPKISRDTTIALYFKRYKLEYGPIIDMLMPKI